MRPILLLLTNYPLACALSSMVLGQVLKIPYYYFIDRKLSWRHLFESGGMPSSHSAMVSSLVVATGITAGLTSALFALSVAFAFIVIYDAVGVRRATGKQSIVINRILDDMYKSGRISSEGLHEFIGHNPLEVIAGILLGILIACALYFGGFSFVIR